MMVTALRPKPGQPRQYRFPRFEDQKIANGVRILSAQVAKLPIVSVLVLIDAGASKDPAGKEGIAALVASCLSEGTARYSGAELAEKFEQLGTSLESGADWDSALVKITVLAEKLEEAMQLVGEVLTNPAFPEREIERLKAERLAEILQLRTEPRGLADEKFSEFLYSAHSRYAKPDEGTEDTVRALSRQDAITFYESNYRASTMTVVVAGDVDHSTIVDVVSRTLSDVRSGSGDRSDVEIRPRFDTEQVHVVHKPDAPQSELRVGHIGLPRRHPDFFPTLVMNAVLGGLFGSRINLNLREEHGYTYGASSYYDWRRNAGPFAVSTAVQSDVTAAALREIMLEIDRIRSEPITDSELSLATDYLDGVFPIRYETTSAIAAALANLVIYDLPRDYYDRYRQNIRTVSTESVLAAAKAHIHPDRMQVVVVGDADIVRGPLTELDIGPVQVYND
jgi:predicted Zn-dependent peptidase